MASEHSQVESCCKTGLPVCRRMYNMNLALGYIDEVYSLKALAKIYDKSIEEVFEFGYDYVQARACFKKEWSKMTCKDECPLPNDCLIGQCFKS